MKKIMIITIGVILLFFFYIFLLAGEVSAEEIDIIKYKYSVDRQDKYGIFCGTEENFNIFLSDRRYIDMGSCYDNGKIINLYRSLADEEMSRINQKYLNGDIEKPLTPEEKAIKFLESLGYSISINE